MLVKIAGALYLNNPETLILGDSEHEIHALNIHLKHFVVLLCT